MTKMLDRWVKGKVGTIPNITTVTKTKKHIYCSTGEHYLVPK
jgi:hypothetical protein